MVESSYRGTDLLRGYRLAFLASMMRAPQAGRRKHTGRSGAGQGRDDVATDKGLLQQWPENGPALNLDGEQLGDGYSSVVIDAGRIYTAGDRQDGEYLVCLSDADGKGFGRSEWRRMHDGGARSTPTTDGKLVTR